MRSRLQLAMALLVASSLLGTPAAAEGGDRAPDDLGVRVYTNADLERFPTTPDSTVEADRPDPEDWAFVVDYIDRQYRRIDADRDYRMERRRNDAEVELIESRAQRRGSYLPLNYGYGVFPTPFGVNDGRRVANSGRRDPRRGVNFDIRPLHARPTQAQVMRFRATQRSGVAAFPSNSRRR